MKSSWGQDSGLSIKVRLTYSWGTKPKAVEEATLEPVGQTPPGEWVETGARRPEEGPH